ncbi:MAG TPA: NosD domain-containing protein, partial [Saprospiraceae bacterium]|nr:NosD domain-containing protein [Saprospiraceae bacterium]
MRGYNRTSCTVLGLGEQCYVSGLGIEHGLYGIILGNHNQVGLDDNALANYIADCAEAGVLMAGDSNIVSGNVIGINSFGQLSPCQFGVFVSGIRNVIGGIHAGEGNLISGNDIGIAAYTLGGFTGILGNFIGTNYNATLVAPNRVGIDNIGPNTYIGSNDQAGANVISGNTESGVLIGTMASNVVVQHNFIGTNPQGNIALPNRDGITLGPGSTNCEVHDNLISDNTNNGILISGIQGPQLESDDHLIAGNVIRYNGNAGIALSGAANNNIIGSSLSNDFPLNEIQNNGVAGIVTQSGLGVPTGNTIRKNKIYENNTSGIRILAGQNNIPPPVLLTYVALDQTTATVTGTHPSIGARIDFYLGDPDQADNYEGREWLGEATVNASGHFSEIIPICACDSIVATATDAQGNTSEFSDGLGLTMTAVNDPAGLSSPLIATPNPFDQSTVIHFTLQHAGMVDLRIRNASGKNVETLNHDFLLPGKYNLTWSAGQYPAGVYYYTLTV